MSMRLLLPSLLLAVVIVQAAPFRDADGFLELENCEVAKAWRASASAPQQGDMNRLLFAAYACAKSGERKEAKALQTLADALPREDFLFGTDGNHTRVRIALALGELDRAAELMRSTSETLLDNWSKLDDPMSVMFVAHAMQRLNDDIATQLRSSDPARSVVHQLLAARAYDLPDLGSPSMSALYRNVALETAIKANLPEPMIAACSAILTRPARELSPREAQRITIAALALIDLKRTDDALALAQSLKATGQPEAVRDAENVIFHIERRR
jgi:hypothetical protein